MINNAPQGKPLPVYGDGKNVRDWFYVDDHAKAIDMVQEKGKLGERYNIGVHNEKQNNHPYHSGYSSGDAAGQRSEKSTGK